MKIQQARVIVTSPGRNFVTLKIETDQGLYGIGDATLNGREMAVVSYLEEHVLPCLEGRDPARIEDIWQFLYRGCYWRRGPVTMTAIAAVDMALWDIKAKAAGMPLYQLLGGACRDGVMVYGHANGETVEETIAEVGRYLDLGYLAVRAQTGVPGLESTYGVSGDKMFYEPADASLPTENVWSTEQYLDHLPGLFQHLRDEFGYQPHLLHDVHHRLTPIEAARLGKSMEPFRLFWLEDAVAADNQDGFKLIRQHTVTPLAVGEIFNTIWDCKGLIEQQLIDYIRATVVHAGGITHLRRIADLAALYHVRTGCHGATDLSPVSMGAGCILICRYPILVSRSTCPTPSRQTRFFPMPTLLTGATCTPGIHRAMALILTKGWQPNIRISGPICPSTDSATGVCGTGSQGANMYWCGNGMGELPRQTGHGTPNWRF